MFYKGQIEKINKVVVSDPSYKEDVWCRYESDAFPKMEGPWSVQLAINNYEENYDNFVAKGVEFSMMLTSSIFSNDKFKLDENGKQFSYLPFVKLKETEIGLDTACVALGANEYADEIKSCVADWQPPCALKTLTDGVFGAVQEGTYDGSVHMLFVNGYFDEDTGYSIEDIVDYLSTNFKIKNLELVKDKPALEDEIAKAKSKESIDKVKTDAQKDVDLEL